MKEKELREQISHKIDMVLRQYNISGSKKVYAPILLELKEKLFSGNKELEEEALKGMKSLLLTIRAWDGYDYSKNPEDFIDDFNDFEEFYVFLEGFIQDVENYVKLVGKKAPANGTPDSVDVIVTGASLLQGNNK